MRNSTLQSCIVNLFLIEVSHSIYQGIVVVLVAVPPFAVREPRQADYYRSSAAADLTRTWIYHSLVWKPNEVVHLLVVVVVIAFEYGSAVPHWNFRFAIVSMDWFFSLV